MTTTVEELYRQAQQYLSDEERCRLAALLVTPSDSLPHVDHYLALLRQHKGALFERYHLSAIGVFGSFVRGAQTPASDLDILVEYAHTPSLFDMAALLNHLDDLLQVKVDLAIASSLKPEIAARVEREVVWI